MTLLLGTILVSVSLLLGTFLSRVGAVAATRARAQTAADAAALAAAGESGPFGGGAPSLEATRFALENGARVVECICDPGSDAAEVVVAIGDVTARARAILDPSLFRPDDRAEGLHPILQAAVERLLTTSGGRVTVTSGYRSEEEQQVLWASALDRYGSAEAADDWVAPPGHSMHNLGLAVDLGGDLSLAVSLIDRLDLPMYRPLVNEPWHFELLGSRS